MICATGKPYFQGQAICLQSPPGGRRARSSSLWLEAWKLLNWAERHLLAIKAVHLAVNLNETADWLSRQVALPRGWELNQKVFQEICLGCGGWRGREGAIHPLNEANEKEWLFLRYINVFLSFPVPLTHWVLNSRILILILILTSHIENPLWIAHGLWFNSKNKARKSL